MNKVSWFLFWINIRTLDISSYSCGFIFFTKVSGAPLYHIFHSCMTVMVFCTFLRVLQISLLCCCKPSKRKIASCIIMSSSYRPHMVSSSVDTSRSIVALISPSKPMQELHYALLQGVVLSLARKCVNFVSIAYSRPLNTECLISSHPWRTSWFKQWHLDSCWCPPLSAFL